MVTCREGMVEVFVISVRSSDGRTIEAFDDGAGPAIVIIHGGMDDGRAWKKVADRLSDSYRVVRLRRRPYGLRAPTTMAQEVDDVLAVSEAVQGPKMLVGHSSGGVLALETMVASPKTFRGAVIYEPPVVLGPPVGGEATQRVRAAIEAGKPGKAIAIFSQHMLRLNPVQARFVGLYAALHPRYRKLVHTQLRVEEIDDLGVRLDEYAKLDVPVTLVSGSRSPGHLEERIDVLVNTMPRSEKVVLKKQSHGAHLTAPDQLAVIARALATQVLPAKAPASTRRSVSRRSLRRNFPL